MIFIQSEQVAPHIVSAQGPLCPISLQTPNRCYSLWSSSSGVITLSTSVNWLQCILLTLDNLMINVSFPPPSEGAAEATRALTSNSAAGDQASEDKLVDNKSGDDPMENDTMEDISKGKQYFRASETSLSDDINSKGTLSPIKDTGSVCTMQRAEATLTALYETHDRFFSADKEEKHVRTHEDTQEHHTY